MAAKTSIEWTEMSWNVVTGCSWASKGCDHCYAERMAKRLQAMGNPRYRKGFEVTLHEDLIDKPRRWKKPRTIFVNSMSDLFHPKVSLSFIQKVFQTMNETPHTYQILTKRPGRARRLSSDLTWSENIWMGTSVEDADVLWRIDALRPIPARVRFISAEPLLGPLDGIDLSGIHWVIAGAESGPGARPMNEDWIRALRDRCLQEGVAFFYKQKATPSGQKIPLPELDGQQWMQLPI